MAFLLTALTALGLGFFYVGTQLIGPVEAGWAATSLLWTLLAVPFGLMLWLPLAYWRRENDRHGRWDDRLLRSAFFSMALLSFLLFFVALRDLFLLGTRVFGFASGGLSGAGLLGSATEAVSGWIGGPSRVPLPLLDARGSVIIIGLALAALAVGFREARRTPEVTEVDVPIENLPRELDGLTIAQISDLHVGATIQRPFVERVVARVNALDADLIAFTGDVADGSVRQLEPHFAPIGELRARLGKFYVTGNHEFYWDASPWVDHLKRLGFTPLLNSHATVERGGARVVVAGVLDLFATRAKDSISGSAPGCDPKAALAGAPADAGLRILLAHQPKVALAASTLGYDLQVSGHTHGGQFLPWTIAVRWFEPFARGLHRVGRMWLYVNRGTGYWGPPVRLGSPSEITLIRVRRA